MNLAGQESILIVVTILGLGWAAGKWSARNTIKKFKENVGIMTHDKCLTMQEDCPQVKLFADKVEVILSAFVTFRADRKNEIVLWETSASNIATIAGCFRDLAIYLLKKSDEEGQDLKMDIIGKISSIRRNPNSMEKSSK